ncbi:helix-turn-helix domain-containing protein [Actinomadura gamaensis]|uniref:Helix-turn-helix domain-containing protein n=1 Tax=Actinomadura gamaensis TaxID=1763541 RepID=A0ABV9U6H3_9ACTN
MQPLLFDSRDLGQTEEFLSQAYAKMSIGGDVSRPHTQIARRTLGSISVDQLNLNYGMSYDVDPLGKVCLCTVQTGSIVNQVAGDEEEVFGPGDVVLFAPPDRPYKGEIRRSRYDIIMFDPDLLQQVAGTEPGHKPETVRLLGARPISDAAGRHLERTIAYLRDDVLGNPVMAADPLVASSSGQLLAAAVLAALPSNVRAAPDAADRRDAHPQTLRRAIAYIEDNADAPITIADIAAAARVSVRAVQHAFRRHLDITPLGYLNQVRLAGAHTALREAESGGTTVTAVAASWGFFHPGRFARDYRAAYGRPPQDTLKDRVT